MGARVDSAAADALCEIAVAGLSVAVVRHGRPVLTKGYGYATLAERDKQPWGLSATWTSNGGGKG